jgi:hypothetical protein
MNQMSLAVWKTWRASGARQRKCDAHELRQPRTILASIAAHHG